MQLLNRVGIPVALLLLACLGGCSPGPARGSVSGIVTLDGTPLGGVFVVLHPEGHQAPQARGVSDDAGQFTLEADDGGGGVVVGTYRVVVMDFQSMPGPLGKEEDEVAVGPPPPNRVPVRYHSIEKTPLEVEVLDESAALEIPLTTAEE